MKKIFTCKNYGLLTLFLLILIQLPLLSNGQTRHVVQVTNNVYTPSDLTVSVGDTVEWINSEGYHNVNATQATYPSNPESFGNALGIGWTFSHVFSTAGTYDYRCDAHFSLGMVGKVTVNESAQSDFDLTVNFHSMNPHVGQNLWIAVIDKANGAELERKKVVVSVDFTVMFSGIEKNHSYNVDFFADHNGNGMYDAPPTDHAWRMELDNVTDDSVLDFTHNTNFTDIMWKNRLTVQFSAMNPHVGEDFHLMVFDKNSGTMLQEVDTVATVDFMLYVYGIENGMSYNVDFYADHNANGMYDAPPTDHAWRLELNDVMGDTTLYFTHNTNFTDISVSTGISDFSSDNAFIYPNPAKDKVTIETGDFGNSDLQIMFYDISGKLRYSAKKGYTDKFEMDLSSFENGVYIVELRSSDQRKMFKLLKN